MKEMESAVLPSLDPYHVRRPRLTDRMRATPDPRLTLLTGPPGSGATALVREWIEDGVAGDVAWICLEPIDGRPTDLWATVLRRLDDVDPELVESVEAGLGIEPGPEEVAVALAGAVARRDRPLNLVLDGLHHAVDRATVDSLTSLIEVMGPNGRVVATSRTVPPVPLARWQAAGRASVIDADQLALTTAEVAEVLDRHAVVDPDRRLAGGLTEHAGGWCAIVRLAAMAAALAPSAPADQLLAGSRTVAAFVREEVLPGLDPVVLDVLIRSAFAQYLCTTFLDSVTRTGDSAAVLRSLADERGLLRRDGPPRRDGSPRYSVHPVLRRVLQEEFDTLAPEERRQLRRRAIECFENEGEIGAAVNTALDTGDSSLIFEVLRRQLGVLFHLGLTDLVRGAVLVIPDAVVGDDPAALLDFAELLAYCGFTTRAHEVTLRAEARAEDADDAVRGRIALGRAVATGFRGEMEGSLEWSREAERLLGLLPPDVLGVRVRLNVARSLRLGGRSTEARELLASIGAPLAVSDPFADAAIGARAEVQFEIGDLSGAAVLAEQALSGWQLRGAPDQFNMNDAVRTMGLCRLEAGDLDAAADWLDRALEITGLIPLGIPRATTQFALMALDRFRGRLPSAAERLVDVRTWAREGPHGPQLRSRTEDAEAELWLANGDPERAWRVLEAGVDAAIRNPRRPLVAATVAIELGRTDAALRLLDAVELTTIARRVERHLVAAELALATAQTTAADEQARAALALGVPAGFRFTIAARRRLLPLLREIDSASPSAGLTEIIALADPASVVAAPDAPKLSPREREILELLPTHLSTQAIADRSCVSPHTVKTHLKHIYRKLGAANRAEAVEIARRRGLLTDA